MTLLDLEPENEKIYFNLGMLSMDDKQFQQAKAWFDRAIEVLSLNICFNESDNWSVSRWATDLISLLTIGTLLLDNCSETYINFYY